MTNSTVDKIKLWVFAPLTAALVWFIADTLQSIRKDLEMVKADVKVLLTQSSSDKIRIDNLQKEVDFLRERMLNQNVPPSKPTDAPSFTKVVAIRPEDQKSVIRKQSPYKSAV